MIDEVDLPEAAESPFDLPDGAPETVRVEASIEKGTTSSELVVDVSYFPVFLTTSDTSQDPIQCGCKVASTVTEIANGKSKSKPGVDTDLRGGKVVVPSSRIHDAL